MSLRAILIIAALVMSPAAYAQSPCPSTPDTAETRYTNNQVNRSLCLQNQLSTTTQQRDDRSRWTIELNNATRQLEIQQNLTAPQRF